MVGEVFIYWSKSHVSWGALETWGTWGHWCNGGAGGWGVQGAWRGSQAGDCSVPCPPPWQNFKREEQNFVVQNEINNMSFLTADSKSKMAKVGGGGMHPPGCTPPAAP